MKRHDDFLPASGSGLKIVLLIVFLFLFLSLSLLFSIFFEGRRGSSSFHVRSILLRVEIVDRRFNQSVFLFSFFLEFDTIVFAFVILPSVTTSVAKCIRIQLVSVRYSIMAWLCV